MNNLFYQLNGISRNGCKDNWNAFMLEGASYDKHDIPFCYSTNIIPASLLSYDDARNIYKKMKCKRADFFIDSFIHFYIDYYKFDGKHNSIWLYPEKLMELAPHFTGFITPDFSTNQDFPDPQKRFNTYRMRSIGYWLQKNNIPVINNVRWGTAETWKYCFKGIPNGAAVSIGTVSSGLKFNINHVVFENGLAELVKQVKPSVIIVYGSSNYECFKKLSDCGLPIITFPSRTSLAFKSNRRRCE